MNTLAKAGVGVATIAGTTTTVVVATKGVSNNNEENISLIERRRRKFEKDRRDKESKLSRDILDSLWYKWATKNSNVIYVGDEKEKLKKEVENSSVGFDDSKEAVDNFLKETDTTLTETKIDWEEKDGQVEYASKWCKLATKIKRDPKENHGETDANKPYGIFLSWCFEWTDLSEENYGS
ncbi:hypothetical protein MHSWG343_10450 [Candidatus Mycoplasma haematohominis]|uniref:Uncharacterized protein n=1 Tax=Candidatus Mycoplasma haematohominis TaxID=1494318 RepID=A0A478FS49_9MOLU|nr:hypothetical protein MHSWG343_10450 [Candidatus Mycoplasma haemohominis]